MLKQYTPETARQSILKRTPPDEFPVSQRVLDGIAQIFGEPLTPEQAVTRILKEVRADGDSALRTWTHRLDGLDLQPAPVSSDAIQSSLESIPVARREALESAAQRIEAFHRRQPLTSWFTNDLGGTVGQIIRPIQRVGLYVPGGTAPLPSSVLMSAIPARVAGVKDVVVVTPPNRSFAEAEFPVDPIILAACAIANVNEIYLLGGAQAVGALAYGTETIRPVDKIFGPGNLFVTLAKRQVYGVVGIDGLAGPTETVVIADEAANPGWVAADMLAQAEHDLLASAILLTPSKSLIGKVEVEIARQLEQRSRAEIIVASLENRGGAVLTRDLDEAVQLANEYAPEHLGLSVSDPWHWVEKVNNAGGIFVGEHSFEVLGDYLAGPSHVMPTGGSARFASPLNVWDFVKIVSLVALDEATAQTIGPSAAVIAEAEGLDAHGNAAAASFGKGLMKTRAHLEAMPPYTPIEPFEVLSTRTGRAPSQIVKLDANENPYGPLPVVREALGKLDFPHIYPDPESRSLRKLLSTFTGIGEEYLLASAGADELIDLLMRVLLDPGDCILSCPPTFGMYSFDAELNAARCIEVPRNTDFSLDMDSIRRAVETDQPKILFIASPNNPDGSLLSPQKIDELLSLPLLVVLDEAYIEFASPLSPPSSAENAGLTSNDLGADISRIHDVPSRDNLVVLRTFSKWAGLAGLRIGYGAFPLWLMPTLWKSKQPYNVNVAANVAAQVSLEHVNELKEVVERLKQERQLLFVALQEIPYLKTYPTQSNFILCQVIGQDAAELKSKLAMEHGVFIRYFNKSGLRDHIRISVGRPQDTDVLLDALKSYV